MTAGTWNTTIEQGATWERVLTWRDAADAPVDLTDYTARMTLRKANGKTETLTMVSGSGGKITLGGSSGTITLTLSATDTAALPAVPHVYDLEMVDGDDTVTRLVEGTITIKPEQTR